MNRIGLIVALAVSGCSTSGPINRLSANARENLQQLDAAYQSFAATSAALSVTRIKAEAEYQAQLAELKNTEDFQVLVEELAEHPNLRLQSDVGKAQARLKKNFLDPPDDKEIAAAAALNLAKVSGPGATLGEVQSGLKQLERERSAVEALVAYARFASETFALINAGLEEGRLYREKLLAAPAAPNPTKGD
ncbi:MAG: hypothetical protein ABL957_06200 [Parvularculaceae bacterium]